MNATALTCTSIATLGLIAGMALISVNSVTAGPVNPPAGPVSGTYKTLAEIEPRIAINSTNTPGDADSLFRITQPGSYYLTSNLKGVAGKHGIQVTASNVTIDLNGCDLVGIAAGGTCIVGESSAHHVTVRNGTIRQWSGGVYFDPNLGHSCAVSSVHTDQNSSGIVVGPTSSVIDCTASNHALEGISVGTASLVARCTAKANGATGIIAASGSTVEDCTSTGNKIGGVSAGNGCVVRGVAAMQNDFDGIIISPGTLVSHCSVHENGQRGIHAINGGLIEHCVARFNGADGISADTASTIRFNSCSNNGEGAAGGAGVRVTGSDNRVEHNNCVQQDRGIEVSGAGNIIIANTCSGNTTNWFIAANNYFGAIVNRVGVAVGAVNGSAAASSLGTTDATANFTY